MLLPQLPLLLPTSVAQIIDLLELILHPKGGFFCKTFWLGSVPMTSCGCINIDVSNPDSLVVTTADNNKSNNSNDNNTQHRNALTSIY
jgi:hypothetical protein